MGNGRGGGQGSPKGQGNNGGGRSGWLDTLIRRANGEVVPWVPKGSSSGDQTSDGNRERVGNSDGSGLNPNRIRGFGSQLSNGKSGVETPSMNQMRAKEGAIVAKFMTFFRRKSTIVIEMYEACFYRNKPKWDQIADFVYRDLCPTDALRKSVKDVQLHPVKMLIFVRFSEDKYRDEVVSRIRTQGITWSEYKVRVKGYSLDAQVKFMRLLGVSPETDAEEIRSVFRELGIGDVIDIRKGLPGVTNGVWSLRVKIWDSEKGIPSYIHLRDEGELWSLNFEGRLFCCWKCGSPNHIGDKCHDQARTFEEVFGGSNNDEENSDEFVKPTWAAVVRSGNSEAEEHRRRVRDMELKIKANNLRKAKEVSEALEKEAREQASKVAALKEAELVAKKVTESVLVENVSDWGDISDNELLSVDRNAFPTDGAAAAVDMRLIASTTDVESVDRAETTANNLALEHMKRVSETIPFTSKFELKLPLWMMVAKNPILAIEYHPEKNTGDKMDAISIADQSSICDDADENPSLKHLAHKPQENIRSRK